MSTIDRIAAVIRENPGKDPKLIAYEVMDAMQAGVVASLPVDDRNISDLIDIYYNSRYFAKLKDDTRMNYRGHISKIIKKFGDERVADVTRSKIQNFIDEMYERPGAANNVFKMLRVLMQCGVRYDIIAANPCEGVEKISYEKKGHHTWTEDEVDQFTDKHPFGSKAYLAINLIIYTVSRRCEVIDLGPKNIENGLMCFQHAKGSNFTRTPIHKELEKVLTTAPEGKEYFLVNRSGNKFSTTAFSRSMRRWCDEAGLPHCCAHGLKKTSMVRMARLGFSTNEIMSWSAHKSPQMVQLYTQDINRDDLALAALDKMK